MSIRTYSKFFIVISILFSLAACGGSYNTDFPPPDPNKSIDDTFPAKIGDETRNISAMNVQKPQIGYESSYGNGKMVVQIIQSPNNEVADAYFKDKVVPQFDAMPNHSRAQVNGKWYAKGKDKDGRQWYGWVNQNWAIVIHAVDQAHLDKIVEALPYIAAK